MEETFFDPDGNAVAYIDYKDENTIYMWDGTPTAYLDKENCFPPCQVLSPDSNHQFSEP